MVKFVSTLCQNRVNIVLTLCQHFVNIVSTLWWYFVNTVPTLCQDCINIVSTSCPHFVKHCQHLLCQFFIYIFIWGPSTFKGIQNWQLFGRISFVTFISIAKVHKEDLRLVDEPVRHIFHSSLLVQICYYKIYF